MFYKDGLLMRSDIFDSSVAHGFSGKNGGVSTHPHTASLNLAMGREDSDDTVRENIDIFARAITGGALGGNSAVCAPQIHSAIVRRVGRENCGEGVTRNAPLEGDGFVTDERGVLIFVRVADCTPILLAGEKSDGRTVIAAVHAGWRGTAKGIAAEAVSAMCDMGCVKQSIRAAIGPHIGVCCYEVGEDLFHEVVFLRGRDFANRYVSPSGHTVGKYFCDMSGMNREILLDSGVAAENIDITTHCTYCMSDVYYSHRKTSGKRGAMGGGIVIL
ncbi:MAG: peptidoglycan editing factor PgeF [Ruminococcaceae bacterium]|nr:peptidoglycan editing factor PgeF [Oscillospiraceae bacterium]